MIKINCELCGKIDESLIKTLIEGVELNVCHACSKFGKIIGPLKKPILKETKKIIKIEPEEEKIELIIEGYAEITKKRRETLGMSQKDFARTINEKESLIHKIETGTLVPSLELAKKLEKMLGVKLIEEHLEKREGSKKRKDDGFTLGDFIKLKK